jgi:branched-subunit amino acid transport protein
VGALIVKGSNFMHNRHTVGKKVQIFFKDKLNCTTDRLVSWVNLQMDLFGVSAILCSTSVLFVGRPLTFFVKNTTCFQKHVYAFVDFLGRLLVSALKVRKLLWKFLKNSMCRIEPFAVLKSFSISEVTMHNENVCSKMNILYSLSQF